MIAFTEELLSATWDEMAPLMLAHWREIAHYPDIELDPDKEGYALAESAGLVRFYTARADGRLVGYVIFFVRPNMHYRASRQAAQ